MVDLDALKSALLKGDFSSMTISCNDHLNGYATAAQEIPGSGWYDDDSFVSSEEKQRCIETNTIWTLQWYPETPVGFFKLHASSFAAIVAHLKSDCVLTPQPEPDRVRG